MTRTTVDIDAPILRDLKRLQRRERKSLGRVISDLLARVLHERGVPEPRVFSWTARPMGALVDLADKEALRQLLDETDDS